MMSVGRSIFKLVGIRNSSFGALELMWNPEATRKFKFTIVCVVRCAVTNPTGANDTDGAFPPWAAAVPASTQISFDLWPRIILEIPNTRAIPTPFLLSLLSLRAILDVRTISDPTRRYL